MKQIVFLKHLLALLLLPFVLFALFIFDFLIPFWGDEPTKIVWAPLTYGLLLVALITTVSFFLSKLVRKVS